ncbi:hypothetical protein L3Q82_019885 [Scortum barcoo]|uniref:Uncharacterized protein n=1 Tax=Scortum barcoo TaxID=214431 RepID=A0ACB8VCP5_9TELE|nr:hypothetical protein L3Q82_019885 [Scortum barcoo]
MVAQVPLKPQITVEGFYFLLHRLVAPLLRTFYETVVASVVSYAVVCWGGGCSERDKKRLNRLIKRASSVCGCPLDSIEQKRAMAYLPFFSLETWILLITFVCIFVMYGNWSYGIFEKLGIPGPKPMMYWGTVARHNSVYYLDDAECAQKYGRVWGMYEFKRPMLAVMDPDMLKIILVKECFTYFTNRRNFGLNGDLYDAVSAVEDDQWRRIRSVLSPFFTSGRIKEVRVMFNIMKHHSRKLTVSLQSKAHKEEVINVKDELLRWSDFVSFKGASLAVFQEDWVSTSLIKCVYSSFMGGYSMDVMGSCALSVDINSISNPSSPIITHASKLFRFPARLFILQGCFPFFLPLFELLGVSLFSKASTDFFKMLLKKIRAERNGSSHQVCTQSHNKGWAIQIKSSIANLRDLLQHMSDSQTANEPNKETQHKATMFVFAGYETTALTLTFLAYNLARNPEIMKCLQEEIDSTFPNKGPVQYEALMQMEYLDSVVNESLRLYPPAARLERMAKETIKINGITIPKDIIVMVPVYALHRDAELWPEPEEFRPDRFSKQNKQSINPYTYLPFGFGPRNCMGMRFALVMIKLALVEVLQNYSFSVCKETEIPLTMSPEGLLQPIQPIKLKVVTRSIKCN